MILRSHRRGPISIFSAVFAWVALASAGGAHAAFTYKSDQGHTEISFGWDHAGVSMQHGEFTKSEGTLVLDTENIEKSSIKVTIDMASVHTGVAALDTHLKGSTYFDVEQFPQATFESTSIKKTGESTADVTGNLTIHGVTKPTTLKVTLTHKGTHPVGAYIDHYKGSWVAFAAETEIKHLDFGVGSFPSGALGIIKIRISTEMKHQQ